MRTSRFGIDLLSVLDLTTTSTLCMFPLSFYPIQTENGRPVHFLTLLTARLARSCIISSMVFILSLRFSSLRLLTPRQK